MAAPAPSSAVPFALALLFDPTTDGAIAAGVALPKSNCTMPIPPAVSEAVGLLVSTAGHPDSSAANPLATSIQLPAFLYPSTSDIEPRNFDQAQAFVRIQIYKPELGPLPSVSADDATTSSVIYPAHFGHAGTLDSLLAHHAYNKQGVHNITKKEGPLRIILHQIDISSAPDVFTKVDDKVQIGWACSPGTKVLASIKVISTKLQELETTDLPALAADPTSKSAAEKCIRRLNVIKDNLVKTKRAVKGHFISRKEVNEIVRTVKRARENNETDPHYLEEKLPGLVQTLQALQARVVEFV